MQFADGGVQWLVVSLCCDLIGLGFAEVQYIVELIMTLVQLASKMILVLIGRALAETSCMFSNSCQLPSKKKKE